MIGPDAALILCRLLFDGAAIFLWGAFSYLWKLVPQDLAQQVDGRLQLARSVAVVLVITTTAVLLPLRSATIGNGWADAVDMRTLRAVLFDTTAGKAWQLQAFAAFLLLAASVLPARHRQAGTAIASALLLASLTATGHAAMNDGWLGFAHRVNDIVHLLSGGAWLGALVPVLLILLLLHESDTGHDARLALMRFSTVGHWAVALVILSGIGNMLLIVGAVPLNWSFEYQLLLTVKIVLVFAMTMLAIVNRYVFVPRLAREPIYEAALQRGTIAEIGLGLLVVGLVAWFGTLQPV